MGNYLSSAWKWMGQNADAIEVLWKGVFVVGCVGGSVWAMWDWLLRNHGIVIVGLAAVGALLIIVLVGVWRYRYQKGGEDGRAEGYDKGRAEGHKLRESLQRERDLLRSEYEAADRELKALTARLNAQPLVTRIGDMFELRRVGEQERYCCVICSNQDKREWRDLVGEHGADGAVWRCPQCMTLFDGAGRRIPPRVMFMQADLNGF